MTEPKVQKTFRRHILTDPGKLGKHIAEPKIDNTPTRGLMATAGKVTLAILRPTFFAKNLNPVGIKPGSLIKQFKTVDIDAKLLKDPDFTKLSNSEKYRLQVQNINGFDRERAMVFFSRQARRRLWVASLWTFACILISSVVQIDSSVATISVTSGYILSTTSCLFYFLSAKMKYYTVALERLVGVGLTVKYVLGGSQYVG
jgi:hypothetical protein